MLDGISHAGHGPVPEPWWCFLRNSLLSAPKPKGGPTDSNRHVLSRVQKQWELKCPISSGGLQPCHAIPWPWGERHRQEQAGDVLQHDAHLLAAAFLQRGSTASAGQGWSKRWHKPCNLGRLCTEDAQQDREQQGPWPRPAGASRPQNSWDCFHSQTHSWRWQEALWPRETGWGPLGAGVLPSSSQVGGTGGPGCAVGGGKCLTH